MQRGPAGWRPHRLGAYLCLMAQSALPPTLRLVVAHPPWSAPAWRDTLFVAAGAAMMLPAAGMPLAVAGFVVGGVKAGAVLAAAAVAVMPFVVSALTSVQRSRFRVVLGVDIPLAPARRGR
jgi:hypothetical protein